MAVFGVPAAVWYRGKAMRAPLAIQTGAVPSVPPFPYKCSDVTDSFPWPEGGRGVFEARRVGKGWEGRPGMRSLEQRENEERERESQSIMVPPWSR